MRKVFIIPILTTFLMTTGCVTTGGPNQTSGTLLGAAAGGLIGTQFGNGTGRLMATVLGVAVGAAIGGEIGARYDHHDIASTGRILETKPIGSTNSWNNPDTGRTYEVTPTKTFQLDSGKYCREFIIRDATVANSNQQVYGTACRQPDGTWQMVQK